ncbi:MAG: nitroreductase family protein [Actinomycetota bacterium]
MADSIGLSAEDVLMTTRSVRKRLDLERPVSRDVVRECIEMAHQAPTGSNAQGWSWMLVDDPEKKKVIADHYRDIYYPYREQNSRMSDDAQSMRISDSANHLAEVLEQVPVHVIPLHAGRLEGADSFRQASAWGSILPAVWSFMMALRSKGLGSAWTTLHLPREAEVAELLGIDHSQWTQAGLFPVAYTIGTEFKEAKRRPVDDFIHWNEW